MKELCFPARIDETEGIDGSSGFLHGLTAVSKKREAA